MSLKANSTPFGRIGGGARSGGGPKPTGGATGKRGGVCVMCVSMTNGIKSKLMSHVPPGLGPQGGDFPMSRVDFPMASKPPKSIEPERRLQLLAKSKSKSKKKRKRASPNRSPKPQGRRQRPAVRPCTSLGPSCMYPKGPPSMCAFLSPLHAQPCNTKAAGLSSGETARCASKHFLLQAIASTSDLSAAG
jgi:hypothetical protein